MLGLGTRLIVLILYTRRMAASHLSPPLRRRPRVTSSTDVTVANGASNNDALDDNYEFIPGRSKYRSTIPSPDIPSWAAAAVCPSHRSSSNRRNRLDQKDCGTRPSSLREAEAVKEQPSGNKQYGAAGSGSRLEPLITVGETAAILNVSVRTVWRLIASGTIPPVSIGRVVRLRPRDIERLIAGEDICND